MSKIFHSIKATKVFPAHLNAEDLSRVIITTRMYKISLTSNSIK